MVRLIRDLLGLSSNAEGSSLVSRSRKGVAWMAAAIVGCAGPPAPKPAAISLPAASAAEAWHPPRAEAVVDCPFGPGSGVTPKWFMSPDRGLCCLGPPPAPERRWSVLEDRCIGDVVPGLDEPLFKVVRYRPLPLEVKLGMPPRRAVVDRSDEQLASWAKWLRIHPEVMLHATGGIGPDERVPVAAQPALRRQRVKAALDYFKAEGLEGRVDAREPSEVTSIRQDVDPDVAVAKLAFPGVLLYASAPKPPPPDPTENCLPGAAAYLQLSQRELAVARKRGPTITLSLCAEQRCSSVELSPGTLPSGRTMAVRMRGALWAGALIDADDNGLHVSLRSMNPRDASLKEGEAFQAIVWQGEHVVKRLQAKARYVPVYEPHVRAECPLFRFDADASWGP